MTDPNFYRFYECNIQCPKMKAREIRCSRLIIDQCVQSYGGCDSNVSRYYITSDDLPPLNGNISGRLIVYMRDSQKGGYVEVYLSFINGALAITPISTMIFNASTSLSISGGRILVDLGSVGDIAWKYNGL